jgi:hypothetical protein
VFKFFSETPAGDCAAAHREQQRVAFGPRRLRRITLTPITQKEAITASKKLRQLMFDAPADVKKRYLKAFVSEIVVGKSEIVISGSEDAFAETVSGRLPEHLSAVSVSVRSLAPEWRTVSSITTNWRMALSY